jgi:hypothetical protein
MSGGGGGGGGRGDDGERGDGPLKGIQKSTTVIVFSS